MSTTGGPGTACIAISPVPPPGTTQDTGSFSRNLENGSYYPYPLSAAPITLGLQLGLSGAPAQAGNPGSGFTIDAELRIGNTSLATASFTFETSPTNNQATAAELTFDLDAANATSGQGPLEIALTLTGTGPAPADVAIVCDDTDSVLENFRYGRGQPDDGDLDGDGVPDSEDNDRDGDGALNSAEAGLVCQIGGENVTFADRADLQPSPHDQDTDGYTDEEECAAGSDPLSQFLTPPQPPQFPWALVIVLAVILLLIAGIAYLFMTYGRTITLVLASAGELIIDPGSTGKFEITAASRRKKGDPATFQILVTDVPEGWDAKSAADHISLGPIGAKDNAKAITLKVEAPEHRDPESAVVTVKAVPLNKQGRKDTFKLPAKVRTITSINVPPDAVVPVKRGGPIQTRTPEAEEGEVSAAPAGGWTIGDLPGVGGAKAKKLEAAGVRTTEDLVGADLGDVAKKSKLGEADLAQLREYAQMLRIPGLRPEHVAGLKAAGVETVDALARLEPDALMQRFNAQATPQEEGT